AKAVLAVVREEMKTGMRVAVSQHRLLRRSRDVPLHGLLTDLLIQVGDLPEQVVRSRRSVRQWSADPARQLRVVELIDVWRWWLESIHDVTSDVVVPFMDRLLSAPVEGKSDVPPWPPSADMSSVRSMLLARLDWTTAVLTLLTCSSRTYLFLLVTWTEPVPVGLAWS